MGSMIQKKYGLLIFGIVPLSAREAILPVVLVCRKSGWFVTSREPRMTAISTVEYGDPNGIA